MYTVPMPQVKPESPPETAPAEEEECEDLARRVREDGFAIARDCVPREQVAALSDGIDAAMTALEVPFGANAFLGYRTRRLFNLLARDPIFRPVPVFARTLGVVERVLDRECLLSSMTAIAMSPGEARQPLHCDDGSHGLPRPGPPYGVVAIWALSDFTRENGGTHLVPGSHRFDRIPRRGDEPETIQVEMSAGSVLFYNASLWHGGGANRSESRRLALVVNYCAGFLRQEECQLLAIPREQVRDFPPRLRRLIGYGTYRGLLGHVDQRSPEALVDPDAPTAMVWERIGR
ncbi:phytanoyl-CoA dioxygenase family protein [Myxococcota bacterium]|nr:phytanoyl-CoA dioxygenase family protein [Myxococcota bacterium]